MLAVFVLVCAFCCAGVSGLGPNVRQQSAAVRGVLTCNGKPAGGIKVKLYDHDTFTPDDKMAQGVSMPDGTFYLAGHKSEFSRVVPDLKIYHKCGHLFFHHCTKLRIPQSYVARDATPQSVYDAGTIKLESAYNNC